MDEFEDVSSDELMKRYDVEWEFITGGRDSTDEMCQSLSRLLEIERELTLREGILAEQI